VKQVPCLTVGPATANEGSPRLTQARGFRALDQVRPGTATMAESLGAGVVTRVTREEGTS